MIDMYCIYLIKKGVLKESFKYDCMITGFAVLIKYKAIKVKAWTIYMENISIYGKYFMQYA